MIRSEWARQSSPSYAAGAGVSDSSPLYRATPPSKGQCRKPVGLAGRAALSAEFIPYDPSGNRKALNSLALPRGLGADCRTWRHSHSELAGRIRKVRQRRNRKMGQGGQIRRHQAGLTRVHRGHSINPDIGIAPMSLKIRRTHIEQAPTAYSRWDQAREAVSDGAKDRHSNRTS